MTRFSSSFNLANGISVVRLAATPVVVLLLLWEYDIAALLVFMLAAISDVVDGFLARRVVGVSRIGTILDPLADKAMIIAVYVTLSIRGLLPEWLVILVIVRDLVIVCGLLLTTAFLRRVPPVQPMTLGKINTVAQILLAWAVMISMIFTPSWGPMIDLLIGLVFLTTITSGLLYCGRWFHRLITR